MVFLDNEVYALGAQKRKNLDSEPTLQFIKPCLAVILISAKKIKVSMDIFLHEEWIAFACDLGVQTAGDKHRTRQNLPEMGENSHPASNRHINLLEVTKLPWTIWIYGKWKYQSIHIILYALNMEILGTCMTACLMALGLEQTLTLPLWWTARATGDLTRSFLLVQLESLKYLLTSQNCLFQYISFVTIGKDPKDPNLVRKRHLTLLESISKTLGDVNVQNRQWMYFISTFKKLLWPFLQMLHVDILRS